MPARQRPLVRLTAATVAVAVHGAFVALLLTPVLVRVPVPADMGRGSENISFVSLPPLAEPKAPAAAGESPNEPLRAGTLSPPSVLRVAPPVLASIAPPADLPDDFAPPSALIAPDVSGALGRVLVCTYAALDSLSPEQRAACEALLARSRATPLEPSYTADQAALRAQWASELANKLAQPEVTSLNSLTSFCRWEQSLCWLERYTTLGLERLDFLHGASVGRTFDLGRGWSAAFGASIKSVSFSQRVSLLPGRDPNTEFIAGIAMAYRW